MKRLCNPIARFPSDALPLCSSRTLSVFALVLAFFAAGSSPVFAQQQSGCLDGQRTGRSVQVDLLTPVEERSLAVMAGGNVRLGAETCSDIPGIGWVAAAPNFTIDYDARMQQGMEINVNGSCDTVLLVRDASGQWHFNDDATDLHPALVLRRAPSGSYDIWVGTYAPDNCSATVQIQQENSPAAPPPNPNAADALLRRLLGSGPTPSE